MVVAARHAHQCARRLVLAACLVITSACHDQHANTAPPLGRPVCTEPAAPTTQQVTAPRFATDPHSFARPNEVSVSHMGLESQVDFESRSLEAITFVDKSFKGDTFLLMFEQDRPRTPQSSPAGLDALCVDYLQSLHRALSSAQTLPRESRLQHERLSVRFARRARLGNRSDPAARWRTRAEAPID